MSVQVPCKPEVCHAVTTQWKYPKETGFITAIANVVVWPAGI